MYKESMDLPKLIPDKAVEPGRWSRLRGISLRLSTLAISIAVALAAAELIVRTFISVRDIGPSVSVYDPVDGWRLKRNFTCWRITPEYTMRFTTDSHGFRGPELGPSPQQAVLFLGDSYTLGLGVDDGKEFPSLVRDELVRRYGRAAPPVINAGLGGSGNGRWIKFLCDEAEQFKPQLVVLQACANDFDDNLRENMYILSPAGELIKREATRPVEFTRNVQRVLEAFPGLSYSHLIGMLRNVVRDNRNPTQVVQVGGVRALSPERRALTFALIELALKLCSERHWPAALLVEGLDAQDAPEFEPICRRAGAQLIWLPTKSERPDLYYQIDTHWRPAGHVVAARMLLDRLDQVGMTIHPIADLEGGGQGMASQYSRPAPP